MSTAPTPLMAYGTPFILIVIRLFLFHGVIESTHHLRHKHMPRKVCILAIIWITGFNRF